MAGVGKRGPDKKPRKRRANSKEMILDAAMQTFSYYGYDGASFDKIANKAGVAKSLVIKYFGKKDNVAVLCINRFIEEFTQKLNKISDEKLSPLEHSKKIGNLFKKYNAEVRFMISLWVTPAQEEIAKKTWTDEMMEVTKKIVPNIEGKSEKRYEDMVYCLGALQFAYAIGGNEEAYDNAKTLLITELL